jgi:hypothetical protein
MQQAAFISIHSLELAFQLPITTDSSQTISSRIIGTPFLGSLHESENTPQMFAK